MSSRNPNHYEKAFGNWLRDNHVPCVPIDERKRLALTIGGLKSFDYLLYPPNQPAIIAEVKGRVFTGSSLAKLSGLECWVTAQDIQGLQNWQKVLGPDHIAAFIFAYNLEKPDVDTAGRHTYSYNDRNYIFFSVKLTDYCSAMKLRSAKWQTVTLSAENFRRHATQLQPFNRNL